jgi:UDP-GlcNAc3NAcA epimerase
MRLLTVVGARPQFVKAATVSRALRSQDGLSETLVHTGQHYDPEMNELFFDELGIPEPLCDLGIRSGSHAVQTGQMMIALEQIILEQVPDAVMVYGDTNSTLAGALASAKMHIPVVHVESGLRSFDRAMPEEINRVTTDHISELLFAPTVTAVANLRREGIREESIHLVGDVMYDAALAFGDIAERRSDVIARLGLDARRFALATVHRAENTDQPDRLRAIVDGLRRLSAELQVILPLHPRTRAAIHDQGLGTEGIRIIQPLGYLDMVMLERSAAVIVTDSGGVQKESFFFGVPCVTLRNETEWVELVELGWNRLAPPSDATAVYESVLSAVGTSGRDGRPYGDGDSSSKIAARLQSAFGDLPPGVSRRTP